MAVKKKMNVIFKDEEEYQHLIYEIEIIVMYLANSKKLSDSYIDFDNMINEERRIQQRELEEHTINEIMDCIKFLL